MINPYESPQSAGMTETTGRGHGNARASLLFGLVSIVTWFIPLFGLPTSIAGLVLGRKALAVKGLAAKPHRSAKIGVVLSVIFLIVTILNMAWGAYLGATGQHAVFQ